MRLSKQSAEYAERIKSLGDNDWIVEFHPCTATRRNHPGLPATLTARLLRYQMPGFRPSWLLTSLLDPIEYRHAEFVDLYHRRWQIETIYREWKHSLDIQNLRSHTPAGIFKEVHAQLLLNNLIRWVMTEAAEGTAPNEVEAAERTAMNAAAETTMNAVDFSFVTTLSHIKNAVLQMLCARVRQLPLIYRQLLDDIRDAPIRKRPNRSYPRPSDQPQDKGNGKYSTPARLQIA